MKWFYFVKVPVGRSCWIKAAGVFGPDQPGRLTGEREGKVNLIRTLVYGSIAVLLGALVATTAFAQGYPAPIGHIFLAVECPAEMGGVAFVTAAVRDENGGPIIGMPVTFTIGAQPGTDAFVFTAGRANSAATVATDADGIARAHVNVGFSPGTVVIRAVAGQRAAQVICVVAAAKQEGFDVVLPATGTGPGPSAPSGNGVQTLTIVGLSLLALLTLGLMVAGVRSRTGRG